MQEEALEYHRGGKIQLEAKHKLENQADLQLTYTPGMGYAAEAIIEDQTKSFEYSWRQSAVAIVCNGTAVLGYGNVGPEAALPVMEGKSVVFKRFAELNAIPLCIKETEPEAIVKFCHQIQPSFGGILLEDIKAPECFEIERQLKNTLAIPIFHDDQHGTAVVVLAGLLNSLKLTQQTADSLKIVINGAGAAGLATARLLHEYGFKDITLLDSKGIVCRQRADLNKYKTESLEYTNQENISGQLIDALDQADIFIGLSKANLLGEAEIAAMKPEPIVFALANPVPEIMPDLAKKLGVKIIATGRADYPNQVNNVLAFPGILKAAMDKKSQINNKMLIAAAEGLAACVENPSFEKIIPMAFDQGVFDSIYQAIMQN